MKKFILIFAVLSCLYSSGLTPEYGPTDYNVITSTSQGFIVINNLTIEGEPIISGANNSTAVGLCPSQNCDIIAVMFGDICVGWSYSTQSNNQFYLTVNFNDQITPNVANYPYPGNMVSINIFDTSEGIMYYGVSATEVYPLSQSIIDNINVTGDGDFVSDIGGCPLYFDLNFDPVAGFGDCSQCSEIYSFCGCTDPESLTFNPEATVDNNLCEYGFHLAHSLSTGNNLIGLPGYFEDANTLEIMDGLLSANIDVNFILGQGLGMFNTLNGWSGNLNFVEPHSGYWINIDSSINWDIYFDLGKVENCESYDMSYGNNLLSYKWGSGYAPTMDALGGEEFATANFNFILGQGVGFFNTIDGWVGNLNYLLEGKGYWLNIINSSFDFKWGFDNCLNPPEIQSLGKISEINNIPIEFQFSQSTNQAFYFLKNINSLNVNIEIGDLLLAYNNNIIVGSVEYNKNITVLPVMGQDASQNTIGYCGTNEIPELKYFDLSTGNIIDLNTEHNSFENLKITEADFASTNKLSLQSNFELNSPYPNPFNPKTTINYTIHNIGFVNLNIYDINGHFISNIFHGIQNTGNYEFTWDGSNYASGTYFIELELDIKGHKSNNIQKAILIK